MRVRNQRDFWAGVMFLTVGMCFAWASTSYSFGAPERPGPGYFPFGLGLLLALLGGFEVFKALAFEPEEDGAIGAAAWKPLVTIVAAVVLFGLALPRLGMVVALPLLIVVASMAGDEFRWREAVVSSLVLTVGSWAIFNRGLNLTIPVWPTFLG